MFSGIVADLGRVVSVAPRGAGRTLVIRSALRGLKLGDSVATMGACLTVEALEPPDRFTVAIGRETIERTTLGALREGSPVHLEQALRLGDRLDGHMVSGHVDGVAAVLSMVQQAESWVLWIEVPGSLSRYVAEKGSICIDGVSLTVNEVRGAALRVNIVPFTAEHTALASLRAGDRVNVEVDLIARYLERLIGAGDSGGLTRERLEALGFATPARER